MPKVSIILPLFNKEKYIARTIESILSQSFSDYVLLVVDDGSTDNSINIIKSFTDSRIKVITQSNQGPGSARNLGIKHADGEYYAFIDADDIWESTYLETCINKLISNSECGYVFAKHYYGNKRVIRDKLYSNINSGKNEISSNWSGKRLRKYMAAHHTSSVIVRSNVISKIGGFYDKDKCLFGEDHYFFLKLALNSASYFVSHPLCQYSIEASDLNRQDAGILPPEPAVLDPDELINTCPTELQRPLQKTLYYMAMLASRRMHNGNEIENANKLKRSYPYRYMYGISGLIQRLWTYIPNRRRLDYLYEKNLGSIN
jgi:glycosyltransferase involved in cell wall biosynthesis